MVIFHKMLLLKLFFLPKITPVDKHSVEPDLDLPGSKLLV